MRGASRIAGRLLQAAAAGRAALASRAASAAAGASGAGAGSTGAGASRRSWAALLAASFGAGAVGLSLASSQKAAECSAPEPEAPAGGAGPIAAAAAGGTGTPRKTRVVVLGTGWGSISFIKSLDPKSFGPDGPYELTIISPRSYFLYTPLLPSAVAGSVQENSILEPLRNMMHTQGTFYQAEATRINPESQTLTCAVDKCSVCKVVERESGCPSDVCAAERSTFEVPYDILILGVGSVNNTFGIPGVREHCAFLKSINDAHALRVRIARMIEHAGLPNMTPEERRRHLNFTIVGGGPTGVELAAEVHDLVKEDVLRLAPHLKDLVSITVLDTMDHLLGAFDRELSEYTASHFAREGINVALGTMVKSVSDGELTVQRNGTQEVMPFGTCVWATGIAMHPLVAQLKVDLQRRMSEVQNARTGLVVDPWMRVRGTNGTILCVGNAAVTHQEKAVEQAPELFASADTDANGRISYDELLRLLNRSRRNYPQMAELAVLLEDNVLQKAVSGMWGTSTKKDRYSKHIGRLQKGLTMEEFQELMADIDTLLRSLPATAQVASQEGKYLGKLFSDHALTSAAGPPAAGAFRHPNPAIPAWVPLPDEASPFEFRFRGAFAYIGVDQAILSLPTSYPFNAVRGWLVGLSWRSFETWSQVSWRNRIAVQADFLKRRLWGRRVSEH